MARVNGLLRDDLGLVEALKKQFDREELSDQEVVWRARLQRMLPVLDSLRSPDDSQTHELAALQAFLALPKPAFTSSGALDEKLIVTLGAIRWNAEQLKAFIEGVLREWKLLSRHQAQWHEVDERGHAAADDLFQVVIRPHKSSLAVSSVKKVVFVPHDFDRTLTSLYPGGCLPVVAHELTHVLQAIADEELGKRIPLATIKGHRYRAGREAGGVYQESLVHEYYFGRARPLNYHYLKAMLVKLRGGTQLAVIRAFYDSYMEKTAADENARLFAVDRALRLYRSGDYYTPESAIEQAQLITQLHALTTKQATLFALAGSSFSPADALQLRQFGLLRLSRHLACEPAHDVVRLFTSKFQPVTDIMNVSL